MARIITLITDFGLCDEYVGVMKGVILGRAPDARIVDISHGVERHNIIRAALLLKSAYAFFPPGSIHLVVVDPGVGTDRRLVLLKADGHLFLGPDNGIFGFILETGFLEESYEVRCEDLYLEQVSRTFHGRDILAPVAARLAAGLEPSAVGPAVAGGSLTGLEIVRAGVDLSRGKITGQVIAADHFGNLQTNIGEQSLTELQADINRTVEVKIKQKIIYGIEKAYAPAPEGELLAVIGSRGFLEISVNRGSAAASLEAGPGETVVVEIKKS